MDVIIIGGVAAGTKVAAKLKRENRSHNVTIFTDSKDISYAGCGLPYYVGGVIEKEEDLIVNTPESFSELTGVNVVTETKVTKISPKEKKITIVDLKDNKEEEKTYDKLVIATGASPVKPPIEGMDLEGVFIMRTPDDAIRLRKFLETNKPRRATVVGGGFIGLELAENLSEMGVITTVVDMAETVPPGFDKEMTNFIIDKLADERIMVFTGTMLKEIIGEDGRVTAIQTDKNKMKTDLLIMSLGVRPNTAFIEDIEKMPNGTIKVNEKFETSLNDIYAVGDCATVINRITKDPLWSPMGSTANIAGRLLAKNIDGENFQYSGAIQTAVAKLPNLNIGRTGLTEENAKAVGYNPVSVVTVVDSKAHYYPGASLFVMKMTADIDTRELLGLQVLGLDNAAVDKMVDVAVTAISLKGKLDDLQDLDLAYAPPFSTAISPFSHTVNVLLNKISGEFETVTPMEYKDGKADGYKLVDVSIVPELETGVYVDLSKINGELEGFKKDDKILLCCSKGKRAYMAQNRLKYYGYTNTLALEGGSIVNNIK